MEAFDFGYSDGREMMACKKRNTYLAIMATTETPKDLTEDDDLMIYGLFNDGSKDIVICFLVLGAPGIQYERYLEDNLITTMVMEWAKEKIKQPFDKIVRSAPYQKYFIDSRPDDPAKLSPELRAYIGSNHYQTMDFYEWKEKFGKPYLN